MGTSSNASSERKGSTIPEPPTSDRSTSPRLASSSPQPPSPRITSSSPRPLTRHLLKEALIKNAPTQTSEGLLEADDRTGYRRIDDILFSGMRGTSSRPETPTKGTKRSAECIEDDFEKIEGELPKGKRTRAGRKSAGTSSYSSRGRTRPPPPISWSTRDSQQPERPPEKQEPQSDSIQVNLEPAPRTSSRRPPSRDGADSPASSPDSPPPKSTSSRRGRK